MFNEATLAEVRKFADRAKAQIRDRQTEPARELHAGVAAAETSAAAFAFGAAHGHTGGDGTGALWAGAALHAFSLFSGEDSRLAAHARALGNGALAACAYREGVAAGARTANAITARVEPPARATAFDARPVTSVTMDLTVARLTITARR